MELKAFGCLDGKLTVGEDLDLVGRLFWIVSEISNLYSLKSEYGSQSSHLENETLLQHY
jgi:hypothetical protein